MQHWQTRWSDNAFVGLFIAGFLCLGWAALLTVIHLFAWLDKGYWPEYRVFMLLQPGPWPHTSHLGVQKIIDWFLLLPVAEAAVGVGLLAMFLGIGVDHWWSDRRVRDRIADKENRKALFEKYRFRRRSTVARVSENLGRSIKARIKR